jgi:predicted RNA binding protein YcfA (HicA-like mRNA interferase family)
MRKSMPIRGSRQIVSRLLKEGWTEVRTSGGSHRQFKKLEEVEENGEIKKNSRRVTVPHPKKDFPIRTLKSIYNQAGWDWE